MSAGIKKKLALVAITSVLSIATISIGYKKILDGAQQTNRSEQYAASEYNIPVKSLAGLSKIYENENFEYYYNSSNTVLKIRNKKSGFIWSTGSDTTTKSMSASSCQNVTIGSDQQYACAIDVGPSGNGNEDSYYYSEINQLMGFSYFSGKTPTACRILTNNVNYSFFRHQDEPNEFILKTEFTQKDGAGEVLYHFYINMRLTFTTQGLDVNVYDEDVYGEQAYVVESISPLPRLGQSGGKVVNCTISDPDEHGVGACSYADLNISNNTYTNLPGYIFVPDGSGALIRFDDIKYVSTNDFVYFDVYGDPYRPSTYDYTEFQSKLPYVQEPDYIQTKQIMMPVWGVAYGNNQDAFVAYATSGAEYFGLVYEGRKAKKEYASISPRFERNRRYLYTFGTRETPMILNEDEVYHYDAGLSYNFLQGDGSEGLPANYVGMALQYRSYLLKNGLIKEDVELIRGPKVDFLICDVKKGIFGYSDVVVTTTDDIKDILLELNEDGVQNIDSTLYGWQNGGNSLAKPWTTDFNTIAGGKSGFKNVITTAESLGYNINFYQQYGMINSAQVPSFNAYCVKALNRDYGAYVLSDTTKPVTWWEYVNANIASYWLNEQANQLKSLGDHVGIATGGISTILVPDYAQSLMYDAAASALRNGTALASKSATLSADTPNSYLWSNYSNFTNLSVYNSQLQVETDSVPFLEIVLSGLVNLYAEYSNFSFYDEDAQLKMIEYNLNPSFILTNEKNEDIMYTNARDWFSTAYVDYHDTIVSINNKVMPYLNAMKGKTIVNREVVNNGETSPTLFVNTLAEVDINGNIVANTSIKVAINYADNAVSYISDGNTYEIAAKSAMIIG